MVIGQQEHSLVVTCLPKVRFQTAVHRASESTTHHILELQFRMAPWNPLASRVHNEFWVCLEKIIA